MTRLDDALRFHQTALGLRSQRQSVIASNIANADTPNYKARDMDFSSALRAAMGGNVSPIGMSTTSRGHMPMMAPATAPALQYRQESQSSVDGNTVDMDTERSAMAENSFQYEASLSFVTSFLKSMQTAVMGQ